MESNEQTELTRKIKTDSWRAGWQQRRGGRRVSSGGTEEKGLTDVDSSVVIAGVGEGSIRGLNGNGKI